MKAKYDGNEITLSKSFVDAIKNLMREEILMMRKARKDTPECWAIGVCQIDDLASSKWACFMYGSNEDKEWLKERGGIFVQVK